MGDDRPELAFLAIEKKNACPIGLKKRGGLGGDQLQKRNDIADRGHSFAGVEDRPQLIQARRPGFGRGRGGFVHLMLSNTSAKTLSTKVTHCQRPLLSFGCAKVGLLAITAVGMATAPPAGQWECRSTDDR